LVVYSNKAKGYTYFSFTKKEVLAMKKLTIVANIYADPSRIELVKAELEKLIPITRAEKGCLQYDLHRDNNNPAHFLFYENWESRELWQTHMNAPHLSAYMKATEGAVTQFTLNEMT
jgi:quinol monooxygenase YgiN